MTHRRSEGMHGPGETPLSFSDHVAGFLTAVSARIHCTGGWAGLEEIWGQVTPDPQPVCGRPVRGRHTCDQTEPEHTMHLCSCGVTWNRDGLTYAEFLALRYASEVPNG